MKEELKAIKAQVEYNTKLLEHLINLMEDGRNQARQRMQGVSMISKLLASNPLIKNNPEASKMVDQMLAPLMNGE